MRNALFSTVIIGGSLLFNGCSGGGSSSGGGGGGNGGVSALSIPDQMTIVAAQDDESSNLTITPPGVARAGLTDYQADPTRLWVHEESMKPLETVNEILCMLSQTGYNDESVLNAGAYTVLVNESRCSERGEDPSDGGSNQSSSSSTSYQEWTVRTTRESDTAPQVVSFWIDWEESMGPDGSDEVEARLYGELTITEGESAQYPYGQFTLQFKLLERTADPSSENALFTGTLSTVSRNDGLAEYTFYQEFGEYDPNPAPGDFGQLTRARVVTDSSGTEGQAFASNAFSMNSGAFSESSEETYHVAFNENYLARKAVHNSNDVQVFNRTDFVTYAWRYGLYDATTEDRVELESGFPIRGENGEHGWVDYHGMWFPPHVQLESGDTVTRETFGEGGTPDEYTVFIAPGRLEKRTRAEMTLGDITGENLHGWDDQNNRPVFIQWNGEDLVAVSYFDEQSHEWTEMDPPESVSGQYSAGWWVGFWSEARGEINFIWPETSPTDSTEVWVWQHETINADSSELANGDLTLYAYFEMLRPQITEAQANWQGGESPYFPDATSISEGRTYEFDATTLTLTYNSENVTLADGVNLNGGRHGGSFWSGPMIAAPLTGELHELHEEDTTYRWDTGSAEWNQLRTIVDSDGDFVQFDQPMRFEYTHDEESNTRFHNKVFYLEYMGHGDLHGIPHEENREEQRWWPAFTIPTGTVLTNGENSYKVKVLEGEQLMTKVSNPSQVIADEGLDLDTTLTPPTEAWENPAIGAKPEVTDPPLFVDGERQDTSSDE